MRVNYGAALSADVWEVKEARLNLERGHRIIVETEPRFAPAEIYNNLARCNYLRRELHEAANQRRRAWELSGADPEAGNNLAVTLSVYGAITGDAGLLQQAIGVFERTLSVAPRHEMARQSLGFTRHVLAVWKRYFTTAKRDDALVESFARTFGLMSGSLAEDADPERRYQALLILDAGLSRIPTATELAGRPASARVRETLIQRTEDLQRELARRFERLLERHPGKPALEFLLAEVDRIGGRWLERPALTERARKLYDRVLRVEPEHAAACLGLMSILFGSAGKEGAVEALAVARRTIDALLDETTQWEGAPLPPWPAKAVEIADHAARGPVLAAEADRIVHDTWQRALEVAEHQARTRDGGRSWKAWNGLGVLEARAADRLGRKEWLDRAVLHLEKAHALAPDSDPALANLIQLLERVGRHGDARAMRARRERLRQQRRGPLRRAPAYSGRR
jgi:tetratricopeptide (TPR) repeat protein